MSRFRSFRTALAIIQLMALLAVHGLGAVTSIEIEHHHHVHDDHHHHEHLPFHSHDHSHDELPQSSGEQDESGTSDTGETHTHHVSIGADNPVTCINFETESIGSGQRITLDSTAVEQGPEEPSFELVKPPQ